MAAGLSRMRGYIADSAVGRWLGFAVLAAVLIATCASGVRADDRVALLVGNAAYANPALALRNPANDARSLAPVLEGLGFRTHVLIDADRETILTALDDFAEASEGADMALVFFAGHGVQLGGENYLLGTGFAALALDELPRQAVTLGEIRDRLARARPRVGFVILDACRNNPFSDSGRTPPGLARSTGGAGLLVAYATDPGNVAYDGRGENSIFTTALIEHMAAPGVEARLMFGRARQSVALATGGLQVPWVEDAVLGEHFLNPDFSASRPDAAIARDVELWRGATADGSRAAYERYLAAAPEGLFRPFAEERLARLDTPPPAEPASTDAFAGADRPRLAAALTTLGFLTRAAGPEAPAPGEPEIEAALSAYLRQMAGDGPADPDRLFVDAAQVTVMLGAATAQRIETDLAALASIETTRTMAGRARAELAALAAGDAAARETVAPVLATADSDIAAIDAARDRVLARLDESREYYAELLASARGEFRPYLSRSLAGLMDSSRSLRALEARGLETSRLFIRHATAVEDTLPEGSYAWLADFLPPE
jgi:hypothetical protein